MNVLGFIVNIVIFLAVMPVAVYLFIKLSIAIAEKLSENWKWDGKSYADDDWDWENWGKHHAHCTYSVIDEHDSVTDPAYHFLKGNIYHNKF